MANSRTTTTAMIQNTFAQRGVPAVGPRPLSPVTAITAHPPASSAVGQPRPTATWTGNLVTALGGLWMVIGLLYDGHTHVFTPGLESFFTPAHGVLYSGFLATSGWVLAQVLRARRAGRQAPVGYGLGCSAWGCSSPAGWPTSAGTRCSASRPTWRRC
jgi:hypothetical protein